MPRFRTSKHRVIILSSLIVMGIIFLSCSGRREAGPSARKEMGASRPETKPVRLDSYSFKGLVFTYYLIPSGISREELIAAAQALHDQEPDAHLILVDDRTRLGDYINYAKEFSQGNTEAPFPKEWADQHVVANLQKYLSGKWMLCEGYGYNEIAELK